jgi:Cupin-like domain
VPDKRPLIAECLAAGDSDEALRLRLVAAGVSEASARYEIARLAKDPVAMALRGLAARHGKQGWYLANQARLAGEQPGALDLAVVDGIDPETFYRDFYAINRPAKLTGLVDHWPALRLWSLDHFAGIAGDRIVEAQVQRESAADYELAKDAHRRGVRFADYVEWLRVDEPSNDVYLTAYNSGTNAVALAPLWKDIGDVSILERRGDSDGFLWLGPRGTLTPWHHDLTNNLLVQVMGEKRVRMSPPWAWARMRNSTHCFSDWDNEPLPAGLGDAERPPVIECVIGPGEAIFLPVGWWHQVEALSLSASVSFTNFARTNAHVEDYRSYGALG